MNTNDTHCQKPGCKNQRSETYEGPNGNTVRVCEEHYYQLVTRRRTATYSTPGTTQPGFTITDSSNLEFQGTSLGVEWDE